jgi:hypothetical protein
MCERARGEVRAQRGLESERMWRARDHKTAQRVVASMEYIY